MMTDVMTHNNFLLSFFQTQAVPQSITSNHCFQDNGIFVVPLLQEEESWAKGESRGGKRRGAAAGVRRGHCNRRCHHITYGHGRKENNTDQWHRAGV